MAMLVKYILDHAGGRKSYRRQFPSHLRPYLSGTQRKVSLGFPDEPGFLSRYEAAAKQWEADVALAERKYAGAFDELDPPLLAYLGKRFEAQWLQAEEANRSQGIEGWAGKVEGGWDWLLDDFRRWYAEADGEAVEEHWGKAANELLQSEGRILDPAAPHQFTKLCMELNAAALRVSEVSLARLEGKVVPSPPLPDVPAAATKRSRDTVPLLSTFDAYATAQGISESIRKEWRNNLSALVKFLGHGSLSKLTRDDVARWRDHLISEPTKNGKLRARSTVKNNYLSPLKSTLKFACEEHLLRENVAATVQVRVPKNPKVRAATFTADETRTILAATFGPAPARMAAGHKRARRWVPWLCAYSGARVGEIAQLRVEDVFCQDGCWAIRITPEAGRVKTKEFREVPLHEHVVAQGFLEMLKEVGSGPIFYDPELRRKGGIDSRHIKKVGERLADWVRKELGLADKGIMPNHAWRATFKTLAMRHGVLPRLSDAITGHALPINEVGRIYEAPTLQDKATAIARLPRYEVPLPVSDYGN
ncbi:tyrosine-type recombinase/integrase [Sphingobium sp. B12D2B]|uniref:tyrosine-type recombinase/integrase n=1 Tax=Sphingobium sp. B12D2B TaxID=2940577 RepID=UPI00222502A1|nr:tyrosine-type recombinase/integrase [Sphingobium sp. B12D2B]MCW2349816.1 integrase [Sphingobium sp. B12D2B]